MTLTISKNELGTERFAPEALAGMIRAAQQDPCVSAFHTLWYHAKHTWPMTRYKGIPMLKAPSDLQVYHEILWKIRPDLVIETGSCFGASALWFADQMTDWGGHVISIDLRHPDDAAESLDQHQSWPSVRHPRVRWITGSSIDRDTVRRVIDLRQERGSCLVSLDADHTAAHVAQELELYADCVTPGSYLVVEDTNVSGRPLVADDPGPGAAVDAWLPGHPEFRQNVFCERYLMTFHPGGWLVRSA